MKARFLPGVSAVIPSFNCKDNLFRLLDSLKKTAYQNLEVIVVDNGSRDNTLTDGIKKYKWVNWIDAGGENIGQTGCYNLGIAHIKKGNHFLYIDSDVVLEKAMIKSLVERLESDQKIGIVTPMIRYLSNKSWVNQAGSFVDLTTGKVKVGWGPKKQFLEAREVQNSGTAMLIRNEVLKKIGGFDNWFLCYFDADYCLRAKKAGYDTWYEPKAVCYHDQSKDPNVWRPRVLSRAYLLGRNRVLFMRRHGQALPVFILFLPFLFTYYFYESIKYGILNKWLELVFGTLVGFFYPLKKSNYVSLPKLTGNQIFNTTKDTLLERILINIPFTYLWLFRRSLGNPKTVLDLGCGDGSFMEVLSRGNNWQIIGIDIFKDVVIKAKASGVYKLVIQDDVVKVVNEMVQQKKRFDAVFSCQLIEHMSQKEGDKLLSLIDKLAVNRSVVATPRGFVEAEDLSGHNPKRHHVSGWNIDSFAKKGYRVYGLGFRFGLPKSGISKVNNKIIYYAYMIRSIVMSPFVYFFPSLGAGILAIKKFENENN